MVALAASWRRRPARTKPLKPCEDFKLYFPGSRGPAHPEEHILEPEIFDIRQLEASEFTSMLEVESRVWHQDLRWDFTPAARQISDSLRGRRLLGYALVIRDQIKGYCFYFYDGRKALIGDLFTDPACTELSQGRRLLERVTEALLKTPGLRRIESQLPHFTFEQLEPCFRAHCFEGYRRRFMVLSLAERLRPSPTFGAWPTGTPDSPSPSEDFLILPWERKHDDEAAELLHCVYDQHVDTAINDQYASVAGAGRLIENIVHRHGCGGYLPQGSLAVVHRSTQKLAGILAVTGVRPKTAHIPQIAISNQFQGVGLGTAMMEQSFRTLAQQGYREVSLTVTDLNAGAVRLYERLGFETYRTFGAFVWNRTEG